MPHESESQYEKRLSGLTRRVTEAQAADRKPGTQAQRRQTNEAVWSAIWAESNSMNDRIRHVLKAREPAQKARAAARDARIDAAQVARDRRIDAAQAARDKRIDAAARSRYFRQTEEAAARRQRMNQAAEERRLRLGQ